MKSFLLVNKGPQNATLHIQMDNGVLTNDGLQGAITEDGQICIAPPQMPLWNSTSNLSEAVVIRDNVVVQIGEELIPIIFNDVQLGQFFNSGNTTGIVFEKLTTEPLPEVGTKYQIRNTNKGSERSVRIFRVTPNTTIIPDSTGEVEDGKAPVIKLDETGSSYIIDLTEGIAFDVRLAGIIEVDFMETGTGTVNGDPVLTDDDFINAVMDLGLEVVNLTNYDIPNYITCAGSGVDVILSGGNIGDGEPHRYLVIINSQYKDILNCNHRSFIDALRNSSLGQVLDNSAISVWSDSSGNNYFNNPTKIPFSMEILSLDEGQPVTALATTIEGSSANFIDVENNSINFCIAAKPDVIFNCVGESRIADVSITLPGNGTYNDTTEINADGAVASIYQSNIFNNHDTASAFALMYAGYNFGLGAEKVAGNANPDVVRLVNLTDRSLRPQLTTKWEPETNPQDIILAGIGNLTDIEVSEPDLVNRTVTLQACLAPATLTEYIVINYDNDQSTGLKTLLDNYNYQYLFINGQQFNGNLQNATGEDFVAWFNLGGQDRVNASYDSVTKFVTFTSTNTSLVDEGYVTVNIIGDGPKLNPYPTLQIANLTTNNTAFANISDYSLTFTVKKDYTNPNV